MATETDFNVPPYFDDYDEEKRFHRILFRPSMAVQARELTQSQTILQNQIERFGNHMFKDGTIVDGVGITYYPAVNYISVEDRFSFANGTQSELFPTELDSSYLITNSTDSNNAVRATIKIAKDGTKTDPPNTNRFYLDYIVTGTDISNNDVNAFVPGDTLYIYANTQNKFGNLVSNNLLYTVNTLATNGTFTSNGQAYCIGVSDGTIFQKGFFTQVEPQVITIQDFSTNTTGYVVGFNTIEEIIDENDDPSLTDNALGYSNENAPGAHRLKLIPSLVAKPRTDTANNKNFFAIVEFDGQEPTEQNDDPEYNVIEQQMARKTYEESGDYVIKPFQIETRVNPANSQSFFYEISPGIAYVRGYRIEKIGTTKVEAPRATTTEVAQNQIITANYGSYVICDEFLGVFDTEQLSEVDLYDTPQNAISEIEGTTSTASGAVVGKANVRAVIFEDGVKGSPTAKYLVYLFNIRMNSGKSFGTDVKSLYMSGTFGKAKADIVLENGIAILKETTRASAAFDTGLLAVKRLTNNTGIGDTSYVYSQIKSGTITAGGVVTITIDTAAPGASTERLNQTSGSILTGSLLEQYNVYLSANAYTANLTGSIEISSGSVTVNGTSTSFTTELTANSLVRIYDSGGTTYNRRVVSIANNTSFTVDVALPASNTSTKLGQYFVTGTPLPLANVTINSTTSFSANLGLTLDSGSQTVYCEYPVNRNQTVAVPKVINKNRYVKIDCSNNVANTVGPWILGLSDVHKIRHVYVGTTYANTNPDRLTWFNLDTGQRDEIYDHARLVIKPQYASNITASTKILVELDHFTANTIASVGFFSVESYPIDDANTANTNAIQTIELPLYNDLELRNVIDFRAVKSNTAVSSNTEAGATVNPAANANTFSISGTGQYMIIPDSNFTGDFEYYLPRFDLVTIDPRGNFSSIRGTPSTRPAVPFVENDQSVIAECFVPAYPSATRREFDSYNNVPFIRTRLVSNKRYTMKDIGVLDDRIKRIEYYTVLNVLEQQARDVTIPDANGLNRFKNGIFADPFNSHNIGNVADFEYKIAIDKDKTVARPFFQKHDIDFEFNTANSSNVQATGKLITLPYNHQNHITQRFATKFRVPTESIWKWRGSINLYPSYDFFRDETIAPNVNINLDLAAPWEAFENSPFGTLYGDWRTVSVQTSTSSQTTQQGFIQTTATTTTTNTTQERTIDQLTVDTFTESYNIGSYVKDVSIQPYMRSKLVAFISTNMKPNTTLYPFFDDVNVAEHCAPGVLSGLAQTELGREDRIVNQNGNFGDPLVSDSNGFVCGIFRIPEQTFRTGDRVFQLFNVDNLITGSSAILTSGRAIYTADNVSVTKETTTLSVTQPLIERLSITDTRNQVSSSTTVQTVDLTPPPVNFAGFDGSCFVAGCLVLMADGSKKRIEDVEIGDMLQGKNSINKVLAFDHPMLNNPSRDPVLYGINNSIPFSTVEHPFYTKEGWKSFDSEETKRLKPHISYLNTQTLCIGDEILLSDGSYKLIESIERYENQPQQRVYNFVLDGDHTYYVDDMLVHNRDPIAQSFTINNIPSQVSAMFLSQVGIYFRAKDPNLGCTVVICEMVNGFPDMSKTLGKSHLPSSSILTSNDGTAETIFTLDYPICLLLNNDYAFVVEPDGYSPEYTIWVAETGEFDTVTNEQVFSNPYIGTMFVSSNKKTWTTIQKEDIKFNLYRAKFNPLSGTARFNNENDEYISVNGFTRANSSLSIQVGDIVYTVNGSISTQNTTNIAANTLKNSVYGRVQYINEAEGELWLDSSTANTTSYFSNTVNPIIAVYRTPDISNTAYINANTLIAYANVVTIDNPKYHAVVPKFGTLQPSKTSIEYKFKGTSTTNITDTSFQNVVNEYDYEYNDFERQAMSKSNEIVSLASNKSSIFDVTLSSQSEFVSPVINLSRKSSLFIENLINNDANNEHTRYGNALSKYVSKRIILADGQEAEDLKVYLTAYRPPDTDIKIYAKFWNNQDPQPFDDKVWTELQYDNGGNLVYSSIASDDDFIEYEFSVPSINAVAFAAFANTGSEQVLPGTIAIANNSNIITGTGTSFGTTGNISVGDRIRIVASDYFAIRTVTNIASTTQLTVDEGLQATNSASIAYVFDTGGNDGIVEYQNSNGSRFIGYKEVALKIVLLSSNPVRVPRLNDVRSLCLQI